jgi:peptidoglycan/LPS O-acetylase OafA/YrhL
VDGLACGALLAIFLRELKPSRKTLARMLGLLLALAIAIWTVGLPFGIFSRRLPVGAALQIVPWSFGFVALVGFSLLLGSGPWRRWSRSPTLEFFGDISYGLYLYHLLFLNGLEWHYYHGFFAKVHFPLFLGLWIRFGLLLGIAVLAAYLSRRYFEEPILLLKDRSILRVRNASQAPRRV